VNEAISAVETDRPPVSDAGPTRGWLFDYVNWAPVIAGAVVASAAFFVLMTFAAAIGLAVSSASPTWRDTSVGLTMLSGVWTLLVAIGSYALGGYIAGRVRSSWTAAADEIHFRDGLHGLLVWGLAVIIGAALAWGSAAVLALASIATTPPRAMSTSAAAAESFLPYELDRLFRSDRRPDAGDEQARAEAGRIIQTGLGHSNVSEDDRIYLSRLVSARTGLSPADADTRVRQVFSASRDAAAKARQAAVILAFTLAAALAAAAAAAWAAALIGGRHRDQEIAPSLRFTWSRPGF